jgi:hypothetical protein
MLMACCAHSCKLCGLEFLFRSLKFYVSITTVYVFAIALPFTWCGDKTTGFMTVQVCCDFLHGQDIYRLWGSMELPIQWILKALSVGSSRQGVMLTTHVHLVPRLRMCGIIRPPSHTHSVRTRRQLK